MKAQKQALYDEREAKQHQGEEMSQKVSNLEAKLKVIMTVTFYKSTFLLSKNGIVDQQCVYNLEPHNFYYSTSLNILNFLIITPK